MSEESNVTTEPAIPSTEDMKEKLELEGYVIMTDDDVETLLTNSQLDEKTDIVEPTYIMFLQIETGMTSKEIADKLIQSKIITDRNVFLTYIRDHELAHSIQTGEFEVKSTMSIEEIIHSITR